MPRFAILAEQSFNYLYSKTGNTLIRYRPKEVVGVIDSRFAGKTVSDILRYGGDIPVVADIEELFAFKPDTLVLGNAPQGGRISPAYKTQIVKALKAGMHLISGMHDFLSDDPYFTDLAATHDVTITDLRKPPTPPHFPKKSWRLRKIPVLLTIGSDCDTGKMTTAWEISRLLEEQGLNAPFIGTGQTGILLSGRGVPVDAVVADFMAGEIEYEMDKFKKADLIIVEGQGSIVNMLYSGVTLGLLHGTMPDYLIMCHEPVRKFDVSDYPIPDMKMLLDIHVRLMKPFKQTKYVGMNLLTHAMSVAAARRIVEEYEEKYQIPTNDFIRFGARNILNRITYELTSWS
ncbi:MAG: DUF1611 domain-containing protein [Fidelibacterota bacterium]